ncbi:MAG: hypothetical protein U1E46_01890 [Hyphomicrobiales bacterium]
MSSLGVNAAPNDQQRLAVAARGSVFTHDDSGNHQLQVNRRDPTSTGSLLFSTGWAGRAEAGLAGSDDYRVKVSADGASWRDALVADRTTGRVRFPQGLPQLPRPAFQANADVALCQVGVTGCVDLTVAAGRLYFAPVIMPQPRTIQRISIRVRTAVTNGRCRLGLYADAGDGKPGALVQDLGLLDTASAGLKSATLNRALDDGLYWAVALFDSACGVIGAQGTIGGVAMSASTPVAVQVVGLFRALAFGALPGAEATADHQVADASIGCPLFYLR